MKCEVSDKVRDDKGWDEEREGDEEVIVMKGRREAGVVVEIKRF